MRKFIQTLLRTVSLLNLPKIRSILKGKKMFLAATFAAYGLWLATTKVQNTGSIQVELKKNTALKNAKQNKPHLAICSPSEFPDTYMSVKGDAGIVALPKYNDLIKSLSNLRFFWSYHNSVFIIFRSLSTPMRKFAQTLFRTASLTLLNQLKLKSSNVNGQKILLASTLAAYGLWFATTKVYNTDFITVETEDNLKEGEVREIKVGPKDEDTILVICYQGNVYATQSKCSHFGFNLAKGLLIGDKIICPLHNAGFKITTGHEEQGPVFGGLKTFKVERNNGKITVRLPKEGWDAQPAREYEFIQFNKNKNYVIIGGGAAALAAIDSLRQNGYDGLITVISKQTYLPYDRTLLSKGSDPNKPPGPIRNQEWYQKNGVEFVTGTTVVGIDFAQKKVNTNNLPFSYDKLLIASGSVNKYAPIKGLDHVKFFGLRGVDDYKSINEAVRQQGAKNITIIGGGFIGMELASALKMALKDQVNITILEANDTPLKHILGDKVGKVLQALSEKNGIKVQTSSVIKQIASQNHKPKAVVLQNQSIPTDVLIMATGVRPAVDFAQELIDKQNNGISTNVYLQADNAKDVYAAGDVASYPDWYTGRKVRIEHYNEAIYQGSVAGMNMAGRKFPMDNVPFFWTRQWNNSLVFSGVAQGWDDIHIAGDLDAMKFIAYYIDKKSDKVVAAAAMNQMNKIQIINEAMRNGVMPKASVVKSGDFNLDKLLKDVNDKHPKCTRCGI